MKTVRTRFAPSPTGALHAGGLRTALFAFLIAHHNRGQFVLRIEDTDAARYSPGSIQNIIDSLRYIELNWDEGPDKNGPYGPYIQSQRLDIYSDWAKKLIRAGRAYADPSSETELTALRDKAKQANKPFLYRDHR